MANLTSARNTVCVGPQLYGTEQPLAAAAKAVEGCLMSFDVAGKLQAMADDGYGCAGVAVRSVDNTGGGLSAVCITGRFLFDNGDSTTQASIGADAYAKDNHTVTATAASHVKVGKILGLDAASGQLLVEIVLSVG